MLMSVFTKVKGYVWDYSVKKFYYRIAGYDFTLEEIKHGLLRGNHKAPNAYLRTLSATDPRV